MQSAAPCLLVANPILMDPNFLRAVVLLVEHTEDGAFGVVLNRPLPLTLAQVCSDGDLSYAGSEGALAWRGGPVEPQRGVLLVEGGLPEPEDTVLDMTHFLSHRKDLLESLFQEQDAKYRLYLGYAGWGPGQLDMEMEEGAWSLKPLVSSWLLDANPSNLWHLAMAEGPA
ncbi:MAG TPA: YqgE/AlgH family protein [Holophagaceae bacterium]|jgi:putative transcriptional regulator|nr:YqgE/AlgH family protein [Holophagaceae bacterium]